MKILDRLGVLSFAGMVAKLVAYRILPPSAARRTVKVFDLIEFIFSFGILWVMALLLSGLGGAMWPIAAAAVLTVLMILSYFFIPSAVQSGNDGSDDDNAKPIGKVSSRLNRSYLDRIGPRVDSGDD